MKVRKQGKRRVARRIISVYMCGDCFRFLHKRPKACPHCGSDEWQPVYFTLAQV